MMVSRVEKYGAEVKPGGNGENKHQSVGLGETGLLESKLMNPQKVSTICHFERPACQQAGARNLTNVTC